MGDQVLVVGRTVTYRGMLEGNGAEIVGDNVRIEGVDYRLRSDLSSEDLQRCREELEYPWPQTGAYLRKLLSIATRGFVGGTISGFGNFFGRCFERVSPESLRETVAIEVADKPKNERVAVLDLPSPVISIVAVAGAEGVYGSSTATPWEAVIVREAEAMGQSVQELAMPALVLGLLAVGAVQAIQTGNAATFQRAWAMVR